MTLAIEKIQIRNLLSFGESAKTVELRALNVLIGPNGSGKSNFVEALGLVSQLPFSMTSHLRRNGGIMHWLWKGGDPDPIASLDFSGTIIPLGEHFEHSLKFTRVEQSMEVVSESIGLMNRRSGRPRKPLYTQENGSPVLRADKRKYVLEKSRIDLSESFLSQHSNHGFSFELIQMSRMLSAIRIFRGRQLNHIDLAKRPQETDQIFDFLLPNATNLAAVLNRLFTIRGHKKKFLESLANFYEGVEDLQIVMDGMSQQIFLVEQTLQRPVPASRLSDGTFRWLCLLAILLHPAPPPMICLEEPETGLHPDAVVELANLLKIASKRTQIVVTTHSDALVDALSDDPEAVLVCEKEDGETTLRRLKREELRSWLGNYGLGRLWRRGEIGGNRW